MQKILLNEAEKYAKQNYRRYVWRKFVRVMACIVVFCTVYALILPAITMEKKPCDLEEHTHSEICYDALELICGKEEHTHDLVCQNDPEADVETETDWMATFADVTLTGEWDQDLLAIARSQLGYQESTRNYEVMEDGETIKGYTRYGDWYGLPYGDWCAMFVSFCLNYAGVEDMPLDCNCPKWVERLTEEKLYHPAGEYTPIIGDLIFFDWNADEISDHVGIVAEIIPAVEDGVAKVKIIDGDYDERVSEREYPLDAAAILGYGMLPEQTDPQAQAVIDMIDQLPTYEEMEQTLLAYEEAEDMASYEEYFIRVGQNGLRAYNTYQELTEAQQAQVTNIDRLMDLSSVWSVATLADYTTKVHWVDYYNYDEGLEVSRETSAVIFANEPVDEVGYYFWTGFVIEREGAHFRVKEVLPYETNKAGRTPSETGYILLISGDVESKAAVGDYVDFQDFYPDHHYGLSIDGYGNVTFSNNKMVVSQAPVVENYASTSAFVNLNLYDYHGDINTNGYTDINKYFLAGNTEYPGFQWNGGAYPYRYRKDAGLAVENPERDWIASRYYVDTLDFGNSYITDYGLDAYFLSDFEMLVSDPWYKGDKTSGSVAVAKADASNGLINGIVYGEMYGRNSNTNHPIGVSTKYASIGKKLAYDENGYYPKLGYAATPYGESLRYLFDATHPGHFAEKKNTQNIDGLFQKNEETGEYYYDSRENHAQFDAATNKFVLYKQVITPNYILYPFGNFLPLNDITNPESATQVSAFDYQGGVKSYFESVMLELQSKESSSLTNSEIQLHRMLMSYRYNWENWENPKRSDGRKWPSITAADTLNDYFDNSSEFGDEGADFYRADLQNLLTKLYNIDYNIPKNFFFGMDMSMNFIQPKDGLTGNDTNKDGTPDYPMVFYFCGDDDVWAYIDNILFLDLTGIHRHVGGKIDFVNGKVYYYAMDSYINGAIEDSPYYSMTFAEILMQHGGIAEADLGKYLKKDSSGNYTTFLDYTTHKFNFYYAERGSGSSVCRINFNFPLLQENDISVTKELTSTTNVAMLGNPDFMFQVLNATDAKPFILEGTNYTIYDTATDTPVDIGTVGENGIFTLKAGQRAVFTGVSEKAGQYCVREILDKDFVDQYDRFYVDGTVITKDNLSSTDDGEFKGVVSPVKDISNGSTVFAFNNHVDATKLSHLTVAKNVSGTSVDQQFKINVKLDDKPLPAGTEYILYDTELFLGQGKKVEVGRNTVSAEEPGVILVRDGQTAWIDAILPGTTFYVSEDSGSAEGYSATYAPLLGEQWIDEPTANGIGGVVPVKVDENTHVCVEVKNTPAQCSLEIPFTKILTNGSYDPDTVHTYSFILDLKYIGTTEVTGKHKEEKVITFQGTTSPEFIFTLNYVYNDFPTGVTYLTYEITEKVQDDLKAIYDSTKYYATVMVTKTNNKLTASCFALTKDKPTPDGTDVTQITFTNTLLGDLTLNKQVNGGAVTKANGSFDFTVQIGTNGTTALQNWTVQVVKNGQSIGTETTDSNGIINLTGIKHGDKVQLLGIPLGCVWKITETNADGYIVSWTVGGTSGNSNVATGNIPAGGMNVIFTNKYTYELPETGGAGTIPYRMAGLVLMLFSMAYLIYRSKARGRGSYRST